MKRKSILLAGICVILASFVCIVIADTPQTEPAQSAMPPSSGLADRLTSKLSLKPEQAAGAAGAIFSLAKTKLSADDFGKLAGGIPEMDTLLKAAPAASALGSMGGGALGLLNSFNQLGISKDSAAKIVPEVLSFVKEKEGDAAMGLLQNAIK